MYIDYLDTPTGMLEIQASDQGVQSIVFRDGKPGSVNGNSVTEICKHQLEEYFKGRRVTFDLPLAPRGTDFQQKIWAALRQIPFGETASYLEIAQAVNNPKAVRAVGAANGRNPISIIVPCHRVIGSDGSLTGYAYGLARKEWLLKHEGAIV